MHERGGAPRRELFRVMLPYGQIVAGFDPADRHTQMFDVFSGEPAGT